MSNQSKPFSNNVCLVINVGGWAYPGGIFCHSMSSGSWKRGICGIWWPTSQLSPPTSDWNTISCHLWGVFRLHLSSLPCEDERSVWAEAPTDAGIDDERVHEDWISQHDAWEKKKSRFSWRFRFFFGGVDKKKCWCFVLCCCWFLEGQG